MKFKDLFALKFTRSLELYFCACLELSQLWWSWVSNWRLALYASLTKPTAGTVGPTNVLRARSAFRDLFLTRSRAVVVAVCCRNAKFLSSARALRSSLLNCLEDLEIFIPYLNREYSNLFGCRYSWVQIYSTSQEKAWPAAERLPWQCSPAPAMSPACWWLQHSLQWHPWVLVALLGPLFLIVHIQPPLVKTQNQA